MAEVGIENPQACPKGLSYGFGITAVAASIPLPTIAIAAALRHANLQTTAASRGFFWPGYGKGRRFRPSPAPVGLQSKPVARMA